MDLFYFSIAILAAFVAGVVDAIAGGGGVITFPTLLMLGFPVDMVIGTSKLISTGGTSIAAIRFISKKQFSKFVIKYDLFATAIGAALGAICASLIDPNFLKPIVSFLIIIIAIYFFFKPKIGLESQEIVPKGFKVFISVILAFVIGFYDGIFGPGTGAFLGFMFIKLFAQNFVLASGNTKILNLASNVVALGIFIVNQKVIWLIGIPMGIANMLGGYVGASLAIKKGAGWVRWIFIAMALVVGLRQIIL